ncbi:MAG: tRNA (adenosine(37)-N6)-dimethylallyltransferase MiaA [Magnetococcales bacterium]|nr:tRNA (adenosine(37)-N6)-dimethylallyltransferase MiaA [Magnetococcales bacterium]
MSDFFSPDVPEGASLGPVVFLMGPTASGKSALGMALARQYGMEIVNADSVQIYRGFDLGSAKPTWEEREAVRHHLLDVVAPPEVYSADRYRADAWKVIADCHARQVVPLFVGGSGLYFRAVERGLACMPSIDPAIRQVLREEGGRFGWPRLHERLTRLDPELAQRIKENDSQRISQGLAVVLATGIPLSRWQRQQPTPPSWPILKLALQWPRETLYRRIEARFDDMLERGLLREVQSLWQAGFDREHPAMKAVGYRQLFAFFDGLCPLEEAVARAKMESRRYAKRQITWLNREAGLLGVPWNEGAFQGLAKVAEFLERHFFYL